MNGETDITDVKTEEMIDRVLIMKGEGYRLVQIGCVRRDGFDVIYSFDRDYELKSFRMHIGGDEEIESVSHIYMPAFLYENELHDLFGIGIRNMKIDYRGTLYRTKSKMPFNPQPLEKQE